MCLTQIYLLECLLWQLCCHLLILSCNHFQWILCCFFRLSLRGCDWQTNFRLLCLWNCQIQANILWKLVRKNTSERFPTWVSFFYYCCAIWGLWRGLELIAWHNITYLQLKSVNYDIYRILLTFSIENPWIFLQMPYITNKFYWFAWHFELRCVWESHFQDFPHFHCGEEG